MTAISYPVGSLIAPEDRFALSYWSDLDYCPHCQSVEFEYVLDDDGEYAYCLECHARSESDPYQDEDDRDAWGNTWEDWQDAYDQSCGE